MEKFAELLEAIDTYELISAAGKVFGPYKNKANGRQLVIIINDDGSRRSVSYPKYLLEEKLQRQLDPNLETVDHLDRNKDNNDLSNLRIVERSQHSKDDTRRVKLVKLKCSLCDKEFERSPRLIRDKSKKGVSGSFCSRKCSGIYSRKLQLGLIDKFPTPEHVESEYYRNIKAWAARLIEKYGQQIIVE